MCWEALQILILNVNAKKNLKTESFCLSMLSIPSKLEQTALITTAATAPHKLHLHKQVTLHLNPIGLKTTE